MSDAQTTDAADNNESRAPGFWRTPFVQNVLPLLTSLGLHAAVIVLGLAAAKVLITATSHGPEAQTIIPISELSDGPPGGPPEVGPTNNPFNVNGLVDASDGGSAAGIASKQGPTVDLTAAGGGAGGEGDASAVMGLGPRLARGNRGPGAGGHGDSGTGSEDGLQGRFGVPGGSPGTQSVVFRPGGGGGNAYRVAFVCDASGSMLNKMASLKNELNKAVSGLKPVQSFNVIFFQDAAKCHALDGTTLLIANPDNKRKAYTFLDEASPSGTTDPIPGLTLAFSQHPQLIYLLTDGDFPDNAAVVRKIDELNKDRKVKVNTIAFVSTTDTDVEFIGVLKQIAHDHGGTFRHVSEAELGN